MRLLTVAPVLFAALLGQLFLSGCSTVPVTGRRALDLVDEKDVARLSEQQFQDYKKRYRISKNKAWNDQLQRVGSAIADAAFWDVPDAEWEFVVFDVPNQVNAFAMPGGKVGVFSGIFKVAQTDDELAVVLAHEISHVSAKHVHERLSQQMLRQAGGAVVAVATWGAEMGSVLAETYALGSGAVGLSFDRNKEREADQMGLIYMARAGYDPRAAITLWERMQAIDNRGAAAPPEWLSTHPSHTDRMIGLLDMMPKAEAVYAETKQVQAQKSEL